MKCWLRRAWLFVSGGFFIWLHSLDVIQRAELRRLLDPPMPQAALWIVIMCDWRRNWFFLVTLGILAAGIFLELLGRKEAKYVNVGFYVLYVLMLLPSALPILWGGLEAEGVPYVMAYGGAAFVIAGANLLLYRDWKRKVIRPV